MTEPLYGRRRSDSSFDTQAAFTWKMGFPKGDSGSPYKRLWLYSVFFTALISLAPVIMMTVFNYYQYKETYNAEIIGPISRVVGSSRRFIDGFLEERRAALAFAAHRESYDDLCDPAKLNRLFLDMQESFGGFVDLGVMDADGNQRSYVGQFQLEGKNYRDQDWFHQVRIKGVFISDVFEGFRRTPHFVIAVRKDFTDRMGFYILRATIDAEVLYSYISSLDLHPTSDAFLINREGLLQTPSRQSGETLDPCPIATPSFSANAEVLEINNKDGQARLLGYAYIDKSPFIFVVLKSPEEVLKNWLYFESNMVWLLGITVVLIVAAVLWRSTTMVNHIREADAKRMQTLHNVEYTNKMASIGRMAAGVAHEINNPLAIINENAGLLSDLISIKDVPPDRNRLQQIANTITRSVERGSAITHRLLGFAKRMDPKTEKIALQPLLEDVLGFQGKETEHRSITVRFAVPEDFPIIESDRGQLQQVFLNILANAFAAVDDGGSIDISLEVVEEESISVTISDSGSGISEESLKHIFEPFYTTKKEAGTGLGLSITYGIVEKLGGRIDVQSKVGEGTSFTVTLPISGDYGETNETA